MRTWVKICGITSCEDAEAAADAGADALGFIFYDKSPRCIAPEAAWEIIRGLDREMITVGVFVDAPVDRITETVTEAGINAVQLHGSEDEAFVRLLKERLPDVTIIKAVRVKDASSLEGLTGYEASAFLLDAYREGTPGGTGEVFDWKLVEGALGDRKIILAGGLTPDNVVDAISRVRPYGVDASSSLEKEPGKKDHEKIKQFMERIREYEATT